MKAILRPVILSLIVFSTTWVSTALAEEPGIQTLGTMGESEAGSAMLRDTRGFAVAPPFGPTGHIEGVFGEGLGYDGNYYQGGVFIPRHINPGYSLSFLALQGMGTDDSQGAANIGVGYRQYVKNWNRIFGVSGWFDYDGGHVDDYTRGGVSFESLGKYLDMRANAYFLFNSDPKEISNKFIGDPFFRQNFIIGLREIITEFPYDGADFEVGGPLPFLGKYGVYAHAGAYYLHSKDDVDAVGWKTRLDVAMTEDISVGVNFTNDDVFDQNLNVSVAWQFPDGRARQWFKPRVVRERLNMPVEREDRIAVREERDIHAEPLINPDDLEPFFVVHVDPNQVGVVGDGTFENPFGQMEFARLTNVATTDIFRVIPRTDGTGTNLTMSGNFVMFGTAGTGFVQQRVLGTSVEHTVLAVQGLFNFPGFTGAGPLPLISNGINTAGSNVFQIANNNEISGIGINGANATATDFGNGIANAAPIEDFNLNRNEFTNHVNAVALAQAIGTGLFNDNTITGRPGTSNDGFQLANVSGTLDLTATGNTSSSNDNAGFNVNADLTATINSTFSGNTANLNGTGYLLSSSTGGTHNVDFNSNTANGNLGDGPLEGGVVFASSGGTTDVTSASGNILTNNSGSGLVATATDTSGGGTVNLAGFEGNTITGNGTGNTTTNLGNGVLLSADGATATVNADIGVDGGAVNTITGNGVGVGGGHGIRIETSNDGTVQGSIVNNNISNQVGGFGISVDANSGVVDFGSIAARTISKNIIDANVDAGIGILLRDDATGSFNIGGTTAADANVITGTTNGADPNFDGEGIHVRTEDTSVLALLTIQNNFIGVNAAGTPDPNAGDGVEIELYQFSQAPDINIVSNTVRFNGDAGVRFFRNGDAFIDNVLVDQNILSNNTGTGLVVDMSGGDIDVPGGGGHLDIDFTITNNTVQNNGVNGMDLHSTADADLRVLVDTNLITDNGQDGINAQTDFFSQVRGTIVNNTITDNGTNIGDHGISLLDLNTADVSFDLDINSNLIARNFDDGVNFLAIGGGTATVDLNTNIIRGNGGDGVDAQTTVIATADINLILNLIESNAQSGVEMLASDLSVLNTTSSGNVIQQNGDDGWSFTTDALDAAIITATLTDNIIRFNAGRGIDILNQWNGFIDIEILGTVDPRPNVNVDSSLIDSNGLQGVMVQNEADSTRSLAAGLLTFNSIDFRMFQTEVRGNGTNAIADDDGNGVYIRVGTSQFGIVQASIEDSHFSGNTNIDVVTESFTATVAPPDEHPFTDTGAANGAFRPDPLARLNFRLQGNIGQQIDVTRLGAFYDNSDAFKTIFGPNSPFANASDPLVRRRNAQREAVDVDLTDGGFGPPFGTVNVLAAPAPAAGTFATDLAIAADGDYINAVGEFVNGANAGQARIINGSTAATDVLTFSADFGAIPAAGDDLTVIAYEQAGIGASTFVTEDASVSTNNTFDTVISDFGTALTFLDPLADVNEAPWPYTWTTGAAFGSPFP